MNPDALLNTELPIIQAPMAGVQNSALAIAVSEAGGLGSLPCAMLTPEGLEQELACIKASTRKPVNLNFFCHQEPAVDNVRDQQWLNALRPYYEELDLPLPAKSGPPSRKPFNHELAAIVCEFRPAFVSFHFGLPSPDLIDQLHSCGIRILSTATTIQEAIWLERNGADAVIAQGIEAGGHRGMFLTEDLNSQQPAMTLLQDIINAVKIPVIAAGGISDPHAVKSALSLGATAVQVGTAYLLCPEATTSPIHRKALLSDTATELTNLLSGRPARGITNLLMRELGPLSNKAPQFPLASGALAALRSEAEKSGRGDFSPLWAGANRGGCKAIPAAELTRELVSLLQD